MTDLKIMTCGKTETLTNEERPLKALPIMRDFRDCGNPLEKTHPNPNHWSRWRERADIDKPWGAL